MINFFRKIRQRLLSENKFIRYLIYAIGEIILVVIGILIAVNINERIENNKNNSQRCEYLNELKFTFEFDITDVKENINAFKIWNPKLEKLLVAYLEKELIKLDSLDDKINTASKFIVFGQRSKSKIEELKYSNLNLISNRILKNRILLYQDSEIMFLTNMERRYNLVDEERRQYFSKTILTGDFTLKELEEDKQFFSVVLQKYQMNQTMENLYKKLLTEQLEIQKLIESELELNCSVNNK